MISDLKGEIFRFSAARWFEWRDSKKVARVQEISHRWTSCFTCIPISPSRSSRTWRISNNVCSNHLDLQQECNFIHDRHITGLWIDVFWFVWYAHLEVMSNKNFPISDLLENRSYSGYIPFVWEKCYALKANPRPAPTSIPSRSGCWHLLHVQELAQEREALEAPSWVVHHPNNWREHPKLYLG
jgi:hypothetical protein